jgi:hypothetical protein
MARFASSATTLVKNLFGCREMATDTGNAKLVRIVTSTQNEQPVMMRQYDATIMTLTHSAAVPNTRTDNNRGTMTRSVLTQ